MAIGALAGYPLMRCEEAYHTLGPVHRNELSLGVHSMAIHHVNC